MRNCVRFFANQVTYYNAVKMAPASGTFIPLIPGEIQRNGGGIKNEIAP